MTILITGGAGFIGANLVQYWLDQMQEKIVVLDKLTYAGNIESLEPCLLDERLTFIRGDILDTELTNVLLEKHKPRAIIHLAAESHVDRSINDPEDFVQTNIVGTFRLLHTSHMWWEHLPEKEKTNFRFLHVSTDEVYGSLASDEKAFIETSPYQPNSPYSASKAAADHLVRAWFHTYGFPVLTTHCSNNYGPFQFPEKLIPRMICNAVKGKALPIYGDGLNIRDWLHVADHCRAIQRVLEAGQPGETYNIGGNCGKTNIDIVKTICGILDELRPKEDKSSYAAQIVYVTDRPGHDRRYDIDFTKMRRELSWQPKKNFELGLRETVAWYLRNMS